MDYGKLLNRSWEIVWTHKYLVLLGVLAALGSGGGGFGGNFGAGSGNGGPPFEGDGQPPNFEQMEPFFGLALTAVIFLVGLGLVVGLILWVIATISRGGLVAGVSRIDSGDTSGFGRDWRAGWEKVWPLLGISLVPLIPILILAIVGLGVMVTAGFGQQEMGRSFGNGVVIMMAIVACITVPIAILLNLFRTLAERACMLEDRGVWTAYGRGWAVLSNNFGAALVLFLIQIGIGIGLFVVLLVPGLIMALCCLLWPLLLLIQGAITAYFSTLWTLAWREWTGLGHGGPVTTEPRPAA